MQILVDTFKISDIDKEGKLYTNVSRGYMDANDAHIVLDYHSILCRLEIGNLVEIRILLGLEPDIECDYLVSGKVYRIEDTGAERVVMKASFGGLLLILDVPKEKLQHVSDRSDVSLALTLI